VAEVMETEVFNTACRRSGLPPRPDRGRAEGEDAVFALGARLPPDDVQRFGGQLELAMVAELVPGVLGIPHPTC